MYFAYVGELEYIPVLCTLYYVNRDKLEGRKGLKEKAEELWIKFRDAVE